MAKTAKDYPVSLGYRATSSPYSRVNPHKGVDYAAPEGTPIKVRNKIIARVGSTGYSTGPHAHAVKWVSLISLFLGFPRFYKNPTDIWKTGGRVVYAGWLGTAGYVVVWKEVRKDKKRVFRGVFHCQKGSLRVKRNDWIK